MVVPGFLSRTFQESVLPGDSCLQGLPLEAVCLLPNLLVDQGLIRPALPSTPKPCLVAGSRVILYIGVYNKNPQNNNLWGVLGFWDDAQQKGIQDDQLMGG